MQKIRKILGAVIREFCKLTDGQTNRLTNRGLTSTEVENCNVDPVNLLNVRTWDLLKPLNLFNLSQQYTVMLS